MIKLFPSRSGVSSLRRTILERVMLLVTGTALAVGAGFVAVGILPLSERIAQSQINLAAARVIAGLDVTFAPASHLLKMSRGWIDGVAPDQENPEPFNRLFKPVLASLPQVTSVVAGTSTGQGWLLLEQPNGRWRNRMTDVVRDGKRSLFFDHQPDGQVIKEWRDLDYDARKRPWYIAAMQGKIDGGTRWTAPYTFFTTGDPGITASTRIVLRDGRDFVIGFDLMLRDLSTATMHATVGKQGLALVLTEDNRVLAMPQPPPGAAETEWLKKVLKPAAELGLPPVTDALKKWRDGRYSAEDVVQFESAGNAWICNVRPYALGDQTLHVLTLAPVADFAPLWMALSGALALALLGILGLASIIIRADAKRIAEPLEHLAGASERIGQLDFSPTTAIDSPITEVRQLAAAQDSMRGLLYRNQTELDEQADQLNKQIFALRTAESRLRDSDAYNKVLFSDSRIPLVVVDPATGAFVDCNSAAVEIYRLPDRESLLSKKVSELSASHQADGTPSKEAAHEHILKALAKGGHLFEWRNRRPDGEEWDAEVHLMRFSHAGKAMLQFGIQDITQRKAAASEIAQLAFYDTLTRLPNRRLLSNRLQHALATSLRTGKKGALLSIDLDNFKTLNDTFGHDHGDLLLQQVAMRLVDCVRQADTVGRFGGDEFLVMLEHLSGGDGSNDSDVEAARATQIVGQKILLALNQPYELAGSTHHSSPSIGVTIFAQPGDTVDEVLKRADVAMYQAKAAGRNSLRFFDPEIQAEIEARAGLETDLRRALVNEELVLYYQRQVDRTSTATGAEALLRWQHPTRGLMAPGAFISVAEQSGLIVEVGQWVLEAACKRLVAWAGDIDKRHWTMAVNVSSRQFRHPDFVEEVAAVLRDTGANPYKLKLELTESLLLEDVEATIGKMLKLRELGITFALDDFGTGFSSLSYLKRLPLDELKIDQSFVRDVLTDPNDAAIARAIVTLAQTLGLAVIAEGVETGAQRDFLAAQGCHRYQGYLFGRPAPA